MKIFIFLILLAAAQFSYADALSPRNSESSSLSISIEKSPQNEKLSVDAKLFINGKPEPNFTKFFQTFSLPDYTNLTTSGRKAALQIILAFNGYPQESIYLDSQAIHQRQKLVLQTHLDTADSEIKKEIYLSALKLTSIEKGPNGSQLFETLFNQDSEAAIERICEIFITSYFFHIGADKTSESEINRRKIQENHLERILASHPSLSEKRCQMNSDFISLGQLKTAFQKNLRLPEKLKTSATSPYTPPPLKDCNKKNIQNVFSSSMDQLQESPVYSESYFASSMKGCNIEGRIIKATDGFYFNSKFAGETARNVPIQDLAKAWGLILPEYKPKSPSNFEGQKFKTKPKASR